MNMMPIGIPLQLAFPEHDRSGMKKTLEELDLAGMV
jgi:hypothetical protein